MQRKIPHNQPVFVPEVGKKGVMVQHPGNYTLFFNQDTEGGIIVTEDASFGSGGYPYITLRRNEAPTEGDMKELIEHQRLESFRRNL